jgi:hypothetical protein
LYAFACALLWWGLVGCLVPTALSPCDGKECLAILPLLNDISLSLLKKINKPWKEGAHVTHKTQGVSNQSCFLTIYACLRNKANSDVRFTQ